MAAPERFQESFCYITTTGRRTGRLHTIEIWFAGLGDVIYVMAGGRERADWVRNLRADGRATVRIGTDRFDAAARFPQPGTDEDARARRLMLDKYQASGTRELERWGHAALVVAFDLGPPSLDS
jgi:deazaflavin-dependent oxidoreductase (nitroreductase family)